MKIFNNKKLLIYGPANKDKKLINEFNDYDFVFFNNNSLTKTLDDINKLSEKKFKIVRIFNGEYVDEKFDDIKNLDSITDLYFVSENHTKLCINKYANVDPDKVISLSNNYKTFGFINSFPQMIPKLFIYFMYNKIYFKKIKITGITFYLDGLNYNLDYLNSYQLKGEENTELDIDLKIELLKNNLKIAMSNNTHSIIDGYNCFLRFLYFYKNKVKLDKELKMILTKFNNLINREDLVYISNIEERFNINEIKSDFYKIDYKILKNDIIEKKYNQNNLLFHIGYNTLNKIIKDNKDAFNKIDIFINNFKKQIEEIDNLKTKNIILLNLINENNNEYYTYYNRKLKELCLQNNFKFIDTTKEYKNSNGEVKTNLQFKIIIELTWIGYNNLINI